MAINAGAMYASLGLRLQGIAQSQQAFGKAMKDMAKQVDDVQQKLISLESKAKQTGQSVASSAEKIAPTMEKVEKSFKQTEAAIFQSAQRMRTVGYLTSIVLTAPMTLAGKEALNTAKDFEYSMAMITGLVGHAREEVEEFKKVILKMAPALSQTPQALADALYYVLSAGFKEGAEALNIVEIAAKGATAGLGKVEDMAKLLVYAMNAYKDSGLSAQRTADVFTAAVREGAIEADGFANAIHSVIPISAALGVRIEEVAGAMAAMSLQGASAQNAAVYLKGVMNSLMKLKPTSGGGKMLESMGYSVDSIVHKLKKPGGLMTVLGELKEIAEKKGGMPVIKEIFRDVRGLTGDLSLMGDNFEYNLQVIKDVTNASGDLERAFLAQSDEMKKRLDAVTSKIESIKILFGKELGKVIIPIMEKWSDKLVEITNRFDELDDGIKKTLFHIAGLVAAIGPLALLGSVIKYAWGGFFVTVVKQGKFAVQIFRGLRGNAEALAKAGELNSKATGWITKIVQASSAVGGWKMLAQNVLKTVGSFTRLAGPIAAIATALGVGIVKFAKYTKQVKEAAKENDLFHKTMLSVNGELKKLNQVSTVIDIPSMDFSEMVSNQEKARKVWQAAYDQYHSLDALRKENPKQDKQFLKMMKEQTKQAETAKEVYDALTVAIRKYAREELAAARQVLKDKLLEDEEATVQFQQKIQDIIDTMHRKLKSIEIRAEIKEFNKEPFDIVEEKVKVIQKALDDLTGEEIQLTFKDPRVKNIALQLRSLGYDFTGVSKKASEFLNEFNADIKKIDMKRLLLGPTFDSNTAKLQATERALDGYIDRLLTPIDKEGLILEPTQEQLAKIRQMSKDIEQYKKVQQELVDKESLALLQAEAKAFGNMAGKIEVLNYELQASQRYLRDLLKKRYSTGFVDEKVIQKTVRRIQDVQMALIDLENQQDLTYLKDMNRKFFDLSENTAELEGNIDALHKKLKLLSELGKGKTMEFKVLYDQVTLLKNLQVVADRAGDALGDIFDVLIEGGDETLTTWQNIGVVVKDLVKDIIKDIVRLIARTLVLKAVMKNLKFEGYEDIGKAMEDSIAGGIAALIQGLGKVNKLVETNNPLKGINKVTGIMPNVGSGVIDPNELIPNTALLESASSKLMDLADKTELYGKSVENTTILQNIGTQALDASTSSKEISVVTSTALAGAERIEEHATEMNTAAKVAAIPVEKTKAAVEASSIPITKTKASTDIHSAGASFLQSVSKLPFPLNLIAMGALLAAFSAGVSAIVNASRLAKGGIVPEGYPNDTFPALLTSGEVVIPEDKLKAMFGNEPKVMETIKKNISVIPKLAEGGIVPPGYPNDSYPALLSSNEAVIPLDRIQRKGIFDETDGEVVFRIGQDELYGILKKKMKRTTIY